MYYCYLLLLNFKCLPIVVKLTVIIVKDNKAVRVDINLTTSKQKFEAKSVLFGTTLVQP